MEYFSNKYKFNKNKFLSLPFNKWQLVKREKKRICSKCIPRISFNIFDYVFYFLNKYILRTTAIFNCSYDTVLILGELFLFSHNNSVLKTTVAVKNVNMMDKLSAKLVGKLVWITGDMLHYLLCPHNITDISIYVTNLTSRLLQILDDFCNAVSTVESLL